MRWKVSSVALILACAVICALIWNQDGIPFLSKWRGGDIMIHGSRVSIGCIAIGDEAIAELFHLAGISDYRKWKVLLAPTDLRVNSAPAEITSKFPWMIQVYNQLRDEMPN
jgi:hypothetical protein